MWHASQRVRHTGDRTIRTVSSCYTGGGRRHGAGPGSTGSGTGWPPGSTPAANGGGGMRRVFVPSDQQQIAPSDPTQPANSGGGMRRVGVPSDSTAVPTAPVQRLTIRLSPSVALAGSTIRISGTSPPGSVNLTYKESRKPFGPNQIRTAGTGDNGQYFYSISKYLPTLHRRRCSVEVTDCCSKETAFASLAKRFAQLAQVRKQIQGHWVKSDATTLILKRATKTRIGAPVRKSSATTRWGA
jgi:hypothetical protein